MSRYRKNPHITPFSLLCPGISRNSKNHHLSLYKGQVWEKKSYFELCDNNVLKVVYGQTAMTEDKMEQNGELYVPPTPGIGFITDDFTQIPWNSEILQSFAEMTRITHISFIDLKEFRTIPNRIGFGIYVGEFKCNLVDPCQDLCWWGIADSDYDLGKTLGCLDCHIAHKHKCVPPHSHMSWYFWTKEGFKI